jgi:hypothetical protein
VQARDGDVAPLVVQRGQQPAQRGEGVGHRAAEDAGVDRPLERADLDDEVHQPAQAGREGRDVDRRVAGVGDDDDVAAQGLAVLGEQRGSVGEPISSSPSRNSTTPTGGRPPNARRTARCMSTPALSSAAPRPYSRPSRSVASNGGLVHSCTGPVGCTSRWAYSSTVLAPAGAGQVAMTAAARPPARTTCTSAAPASVARAGRAGARALDVGGVGVGRRHGRDRDQSREVVAAAGISRRTAARRSEGARIRRA